MKTYIKCRFCESNNIKVFLDLGDVPLAGGFMEHKEDIKNEKMYALRLYFCEDCFIVSVKDIIPGDVIFNGFYYYTSSSIKTLVEHAEIYAKTLKKLLGEGKKVLELGCNDGVLLHPLKREKMLPYGIDPSTNAIKKISSDIPTINDFFTSKTAKNIVNKYGTFDCVTSSNTFAHIEDMNDVMKGIDIILNKDGVLIIEVHYLLSIMENLQYDMIYHEHMSYYSISSLKMFMKQYNFEIFKVETIPVHGGSIRIYCQKSHLCNNIYNIDSSVEIMINKEEILGIHNFSYYTKFFDKIFKLKNDLLELLKEKKKEGKNIYGYGASGRGTIVTSFCGITNEYLDGVIDDSPVKQGAITPYSHFKIEDSNKILYSDNSPDYCLLFCWSFIDEVKKKHAVYKGKFIVPIPKVYLI